MIYKTVESITETPEQMHIVVRELNKMGKMKIVSDLEAMGGIILCVDSKKNIPEPARQKKAIFAELYLTELGFGTVYNFVKDGNEKGLVAADMWIEYDLHKKPYTIKRANLQEIKSLQDLIKNTGVKIKVARTFIDAKGMHEERVHNTEFKQAIANYLKQHQK